MGGCKHSHPCDSSPTHLTVCPKRAIGPKLYAKLRSSVHGQLTYVPTSTPMPRHSGTPHPVTHAPLGGPTPPTPLRPPLTPDPYLYNPRPCLLQRVAQRSWW